ncbi:MAG: DNA methylase [Christensenellales bacterium]
MTGEFDVEERKYIAIDLKSFYASVECVDRGLDPLNTYLVVADESRTSKTICLAVSPALKSHGVPGRPRLFEVEQIVKEINATRAMNANLEQLNGTSYAMRFVNQRKDIGIKYYIAKPRMARYIEVSKQIYGIYLRYVAPEDIHVYSIDEVFIDATPYLRTYSMTPKELAMKMITEVLDKTGITATVGIGTNLYLAKIAMDIVAKHIEANADGVRLAELDEISYRRLLWGHTPITDFWRVGKGYKKRLASVGIHTMGDVARCSLGSQEDFHNEALLYKLFGVNAELLIDHAWGVEPCMIRDIKAYTPSSNSINSGQVLKEPYAFSSARIVVSEMADALSLDLIERDLMTDGVSLTIGYDVENISDPHRRARYKGEIIKDGYGRLIPKPAHMSYNLGDYTNSSDMIVRTMLGLYDRIVGKDMLIRRITIAANNVLQSSVLTDKERENSKSVEQISLFDIKKRNEKDLGVRNDIRHDNREKNSGEALHSHISGQQEYTGNQSQTKQDAENEDENIAKAMLKIKKKYGKNAILKGTSYQEGATARERNGEIGGHKA